MSEGVKAKCPICNGSKRMPIVDFVDYEKKVIKVACTACGGKGWILSIDRSAPPKSVGRPRKSSTSRVKDEGWRKHGKWDNLHYFRGGKPLCRVLRSPSIWLESQSADDPDPSIMCPTCFRKAKGETPARARSPRAEHQQQEPGFNY